MSEQMEDNFYLEDTESQMEISRRTTVAGTVHSSGLHMDNRQFLST